MRGISISPSRELGQALIGVAWMYSVKFLALANENKEFNVSMIDTNVTSMGETEEWGGNARNASLVNASR